MRGVKLGWGSACFHSCASNPDEQAGRSLCSHVMLFLTLSEL